MKLLSITVPLALVAFLALAGCRRKPEPPPAPAPVEDQTSATETPATPAAPPAPLHPPADVAEDAPAAQKPDDQLPTAVPDSSLKLPIHKELTEAVHLYRIDNAKLPGDFTVLVKERYLKQIPSAPPGKKFALDRARLQVVITDR